MLAAMTGHLAAVAAAAGCCASLWQVTINNRSEFYFHPHPGQATDDAPCFTKFGYAWSSVQGKPHGLAP